MRQGTGMWEASKQEESKREGTRGRERAEREDRKARERVERRPGRNGRATERRQMGRRPE